jgi:hypothetical protein
MENLTENTAAVKTAPTIMSIADFCKSRNLTEIVPKVRVNANGYPYVTFIDGAKNLAENIYFTKNASDTVEEDMDLRIIAKDLQIVFVTNSDGEERIKLSRKSTSRLSIDDLFA